ncbi:hypothetical protein V8E54_008117 [Elaphomyces granulatus]
MVASGWLGRLDPRHTNPTPRDIVTWDDARLLSEVIDAGSYEQRVLQGIPRKLAMIWLYWTPKKPLTPELRYSSFLRDTPIPDSHADCSVTWRKGSGGGAGSSANIQDLGAGALQSQIILTRSAENYGDHLGLQKFRSSICALPAGLRPSH